MTDPAPKTKELLDQMIGEIDDRCIKLGLPPLSPIVTFENGRPCDAFWQTVKRHNLRKEGETDEQVYSRLLLAAYEAEYGPIPEAHQFLDKGR